MKCSPDVVKLMHDYLDEEIEQQEEKKLREHLQGCDDCQKHFIELKKAIAFVQSTTHIEAPKDFTSSVMANLPKEKRTIKYNRWFRAHPMVTAAAVFLLLMLGSVFSFWSNDGQLSVSKQANLQIEDHLVIVPEGKVVEGDLVIRNGDLKVEGEVRGNVVIINGEQHLASAGQVTGDIKEINELFEWVWYNVKSIVSETFNLEYQD